MKYFPAKRYDDAGLYAQDYFELMARSVQNLDWDKIREAGDMLLAAISEDRCILSCGNGGSAAIANHLVCDCLKGVQANTALRPRVISLSTTVELITAIANDMSYDEVFSFQARSLGREGDVLIAISSSGDSQNIVEAIAMAQNKGMKTIAMTGFTGGRAHAMADVGLHVPCENYGIVEDVHQSLMHILAQYVRNTAVSPVDLLGEVKF